jgi:hypothetical protein
MLKLRTLALALSVMGASSAFADTFTGTLYYTTFNGGQNVNKVDYTYDSLTQSFGLAPAVNVASLSGADGIVFDSHGNLLVGGQGTGFVYQVNPTTGSVISQGATGAASFHLTLDPSGNKVYTSDFGGALKTLALTPGVQNATTTGISGGDTGITQLAFGDAGTVFYVDGSPNGFGNLGTINIATGATTRLYSSVAPAHGLIYDPYTDLMTMFGAGYVGTMSATNGAGLKSFQTGVCDFDQGAVDGHGHALVAGCNGITFIDYSATHDITSASNVIKFIGGFNNIDDVAPLVGAGSSTPPVPEPSTYALMLAGLGVVSWAARRGKTAA